MEIWDLYTENRELTGRTHVRGDEIPDGCYHLVVHVWIRNEWGEYLISQRAADRPTFPLMWECTGGSALAGDDSLTAAIREVREETGLVLQPQNGQLLMSLKREDNFDDIWLFRQTFNLADVKLLEGETCGAMLATMDEIRQMKQQGILVPYAFLEEMFHAIQNAGGDKLC